MSKARSPRDVCSTTMGTSGLMLLALFRSSIRIPAGGPHGVGDGFEEPTNRLFRDSRRLDAARELVQRRYEPGVQMGFSTPGGRSCSGVHSFSRAAACS